MLKRIGLRVFNALRRCERRYHLRSPAEANPLQEIVGEGDPQRFSAHFGDSAHAKLPQAELGFEFYEAVRALGKVETELVIYPDQPHGVRDPRLLRDLMMRNVEWFTRLIPVAGAGATSEQRFVVRQVASEFLTNPFPNVETV